MTGIVDFRTELLDETGAPITASNPLPVSGGGGGGGGSLSDTVFQDSTGQLFVYRDTGSGTPSAYAVPAWTLYTPVGVVTQSGASETTAQDMILLLTRMLNYLNAPQGYDKSLQRQRGTVVLESGTVTTVSSLSNLAAIGGYNASMQVLDTNRTAWAQCVRARIS